MISIFVRCRRDVTFIRASRMTRVQLVVNESSFVTLRGAYVTGAYLKVFGVECAPTDTTLITPRTSTVCIKYDRGYVCNK